ncbi:MAG: glucose-1-phosphate adenylyltransferase [Lachnospiraceae bacterium]|nr:glucose-1-phosphate adenylyltransferase [Lachnospiraceae bacterium]
MVKKRMIAMLLAGGQGSRLGVLTAKLAKPAVSFGGKYRIIDFPLSNCVNSGVDTVGVLTQYRPLRLNAHIGIGISWDLDRKYGGVRILPPYEKNTDSEWYTGTANAIYQNIEFMDEFNPDYVLILSGDHIYKMDYEDMLEEHIKNGAQVTIAGMPVPWEEASRFGILIDDGRGRITAFDEKPKNPRSNLASMGIYIFNYSLLKESLIKLKDVPECDFGKHVIPYCFENGKDMFTYRFTDYWKDVGTLSSYWEANMELLDDSPELDFYEKYNVIYTKAEVMRPQFIAEGSVIKNSMVSEGAVVAGEVIHSILGPAVKIEEGARVVDSIIMQGSIIKKGAVVEKAIVSEHSVIGDSAHLGVGEYAESLLDKRVYCSELVTIDENTVVPAGVSIGKNTAVSGITEESDYPGGTLPSGGFIIKEGGLGK